MKIIIKLKKARDRIRELYAEAEEIRERQVVKLIPVLPFILILCIGSGVASFIGYFFYNTPFSGMFVGLLFSFILFLSFYDE